MVLRNCILLLIFSTGVPLPDRVDNTPLETADAEQEVG